MHAARNPSPAAGFGPLALVVVGLLLCVLIAKTSPSIFTAPAQNAKPTHGPGTTDPANAYSAAKAHGKAGGKKGSSSGGRHRYGGGKAPDTSKSSAPAVSRAASISVEGTQEVAAPITVPHESRSTHAAAPIQNIPSEPKQAERNGPAAPAVNATGTNVGASGGANSPVSIGKEIEVQSHNGDKLLVNQTSRTRANSAEWDGLVAHSASVKRLRRGAHKVRHPRKKRKMPTTRSGHPSVTVKGNDAGGTSGATSPVTVGSKDTVQSNNNSPVVTGSAPGVGGVNSGPNSGSEVSGSGNGSTNNGSGSGSVNSGPGDGSTNNGPGSGSVNNGSGNNSDSSGEGSIGSITGSNGAGGSSSTTVTTTITSTTTTTNTTVTSTNNNEQSAGQTEENTTNTTITVANE